MGMRSGLFSFIMAAVCMPLFLGLYTGCSSSGGVVEDEYSDLGDAVSDDSDFKDNGAMTPPPLSIDPENPAAAGDVEIEISIDGAETVSFTANGEGCGTVASTEGANPLTINGTAGEKGHCDMVVTAGEEIYAGRFEVTATEPDIPPISSNDDIWEQGDLPGQIEGGPEITDVSVDDSLASGSTNTFTIDYNYDGYDIVGVYLQIGDHPHGYFYAPTSGSGGQATFDLVIDSDYFDDMNASGTDSQDIVIVAVDELNRVGPEYTAVLAIVESENADISADFGLSSSYRVSGKITFEKFIVTAKSGRTSSSVMVPVRQATVKVISKKDNATVLGQGTTREDGTYDITFTNGTGNPSYFVQVYTTSASLKQSVKNRSDNIFAVRSQGNVDGSTEPTKTGLNLAIREADNAGAFNIWDIGVTANTFAKAATGIAAPTVEFLWTRGEKPNDAMSSFYSTDDSGMPTIAILGDPSDTDEYDDMVIGHEYGHFVMGQYSQDDSPGGDHDIDSYSIPPLALSEAWATFFAGMILGRSVYIDSKANGVAISYSFETPPSSVPRGTEDGTLGGQVSEAIANAVLWDLFDTTNEKKDTLENKAVAIWKVLTVYLKPGYAKFSDRGYAGRDLVDFLDGWICLGFANIGDDDAAGLRGAAVGLVELPAEYVDADLASCR